MAPRTRIRHRDIRLVLPTDVGVDQDERELAKGRYFEAVCLTADSVGDFVYLSADPTGGFRQVTKVDPKSGPAMPAIGVIISKKNSTRCLVQTSGEIAASGLTTNSTLFIGTDSQITDSHPTPGSGEIVRVQVAGVALEPTVFLLRLGGTLWKLRG